MDIHVCKQCGTQFVYCRACVFRPIRYKDAGFCSKECYEASKHVVVEPKIIDEVILVEEPKQFNEIIEDVIPTEEEVFIEAEVEALVSTETPIVETTMVVEPTIKKETNTYKKKKNRY